MKKGLPKQSAFLQRLTGAAVLMLLAVAAFGQQSVVPGATALESETEEVRRYTVELIIFEYLNRSSAGTEIFDPDLPPVPPEEDAFYSDKSLEMLIDAEPFGVDQPDSGDVMFDENGDLVAEPVVNVDDIAIEMIPTYEQAGFKVLGPEEYVLNDAYERLQNLDAYRPLMRVAWTQPTLEKDDTFPITLRRLGNPPLRLDGTVTLYLSRFLHLVVDLALEEKTPIRNTPANNRLRRFGDDDSGFGFDSDFVNSSTFYRINEDRIVRNGELRYYDHPRFGVLAKITRVEEDNPGDRGNDTDLFATPTPGQN